MEETKKAYDSISGDLLTFPASVLVQQCNTVARKPHGLSQTLFKAFPYADIYTTRGKEPYITGTVELRLSTNHSGPDVANLIGQKYPGKSKRADDTYEHRVFWFETALEALLEEANQNEAWTTIAFPYKIGCGLAGGDWSKYEKLIDAFARRYKGRTVIVKMEE